MSFVCCLNWSNCISVDESELSTSKLVTNGSGEPVLTRARVGPVPWSLGTQGAGLAGRAQATCTERDNSRNNFIDNLTFWKQLGQRWKRLSRHWNGTGKAVQYIATNKCILKATLPDLMASTLTVKPVPGAYDFLLLNRMRNGETLPICAWVYVFGDVDFPHNL